MARKLTTEEFIDRAKTVHGDKFDYSKTVYVSANIKLTIICSIHGEFTQRPTHHTNGRGCAACNGNNIKHTTESFIKKAKAVHGDKFDYSKVDYKNNNTKVIIICPDHGEFTQIPRSHLSGIDCAACIGVKKHTTKSFIEKVKAVHGLTYDYSKVVYKNNATKVIVICPDHGEFIQTPNAHLSGHGCRVCYDELTVMRLELPIEVWQDRLPGDKLQYIEGEIHAACKTCGKMHLVNKNNISARWGAFLGKIGGENNFYCSDPCKNACPVFGFNPKSIDPRSKLAVDKEDKDVARQCQTDHLKKVQCGTHGYNYCEKCGDIIDVELHHTQEVAKYGKDAINSAGHILLCAGCHVEAHSLCAA